MIHALVKKGAILQYSAVTSAPEIMAYAKKLDGFIYISASHNPVGHNGIKFGTNDGGVLCAQENKKLVDDFLKRLSDDKGVAEAVKKAYSCTTSELKAVYEIKDSSKTVQSITHLLLTKILQTKQLQEQIIKNIRLISLACLIPLSHQNLLVLFVILTEVHVIRVLTATSLRNAKSISIQ